MSNFGAQYNLPPLGADPAFVTFSGTSSGSYMSGQLTMIHSSIVKGAGINQGSLLPLNFQDSVLKDDDYKTWLKTKSDAGEVDNVSNLNNKPIFISSGSQDQMVPPARQVAVKAVFDEYKANTEYKVLDVGHSYPDGKDDITGQILTHIYKGLGYTLKAKEVNRDAWMDKGILRKYNQHQFSDVRPDGFAEQGYLYLPNNCITENAKCKVHFFLHGCGGTCYMNGQTFRSNNMLSYAASNDIIMVFPQAAPDTEINKNSGCWNLLVDKAEDQVKQQTNQGTQAKAFKKLIEQITKSREANYDYKQLNIAKADKNADRCDPAATYMQDEGAMHSLWGQSTANILAIAAVSYFLY